MRIKRTALGKYKYGHWVALMDIYHERVEEVMPALAKQMAFELPKELTLRPFNTKNGKSGINGRAAYSKAKGHTIIMCLELCHKMPDYGIWVVDHECAHIACCIKHRNWSHDAVFTKAFIDAMNVPRKNIYLKDVEGHGRVQSSAACVAERKK